MEVLEIHRVGWLTIHSGTSAITHTLTHIAGGCAPVVVAGSSLRGATFAQLEGRRRPVGVLPDMDVNQDD